MHLASLVSYKLKMSYYDTSGLWQAALKKFGGLESLRNKYATSQSSNKQTTLSVLIPTIRPHWRR
jgi:hypothetical protein